MMINKLIKKFSGVTFIVMLFVVLLSCVFLKAGHSYVFDADSEAEVELIVGELEIIKAYSPTRVAITDPSIADIDKVEGDEILLVGKKAGNASLAIWDKYGERSLSIRVYSEDLASLKNRLQQLLANFTIKDLAFKTSKEEGKIVLLGEILSDDEKRLQEVLNPLSDRIINLIKFIDQTAIVQIDVQVLELSKSGSEALGIDWMQALQLREEPYSASTSTTGGVTTTLNKIDSFAKIFRVMDWSRDALTAKLNLIVNEGKGRVLSRPKLVCLSGKEAEFLVGGEVPIVTTTTSSGGNVSTNVEFRKYGINLKIKPIVREEEIDTTINTEVSDIDYANAVTVSGSRIPAFASRSASTQVYLKDGQTVFIAGLIKNKDSTTINGVPFLKDVPFFGAIFRSKTTSDADTELVISLTPTIVKSGKKPSSIGSANLVNVPPVDMPIPPSDEEDSDILSEGFVSQAALLDQEQLPEAVSSYALSVAEKIASAVTFPEEAKKYKWQGTVKLGLRILSDGSLIESTIDESSGYDVFDENALAAAKKQAPYSSFPKDISATELSLGVPVAYKLEP